MKNTQDMIVFKDKDLSIEVKVDLKEETVWLTQLQMASLFEVSLMNINLHTNNIISEQELDIESTVKDSFIVRIEGNRQVRRIIRTYNLDMIGI